jgi:DDE superfamily endonuclease
MIFSPRSLGAVLRLPHPTPFKRALMACMGAFDEPGKKKKKRRQPNRKRPRGWALLEMNHMSDALFQRMFRMDREGFNSLLRRIRGRMRNRNELQAIRSSGSWVTKKTRLACTLRWLAGGSYVDICFAFAVGNSTFYKADGILWPTVDALLTELDMTFPINSRPTLERLGDEFGAYSHGAFQNCVGAIDGLVIRTRAPYKTEHRNPIAFRNRKGTYGLLALGIADLNGRFLMFTCNHTGSTHDSLAWGSTYLKHYIDEGRLPSDFFLIGDEAFSCTNQMLSPYPGTGLLRFEDSFNYHLSKCRQCIERAFGMLVRRWGIFQRKLSCDYERWSKVAMVCAKLHNYCCDRRLPDVPVQPV